MRLARRAGLLTNIVVLCLLTANGPAAANTNLRQDANDTAGRLDVRSISHGHRPNGKLVHTISIYKGWRSGILDRRLTGIDLFLDVDDQPGPDLYISVEVDDDGRLRAPIRDWDTDRRMGTADPSKPTEKTLLIEFSPSDLGTSVQEYSWTARTTFHQEGHPRCDEDDHGDIGCTDHAPNRGVITHRF